MYTLNRGLCVPSFRPETVAVPETSSIGTIAPDTLESDELSGVMAVWREHAGEAGVPARDAVLPKPMRAYLRHISLVRWIAEDNDYEFRFFGDAHAQAYGVARKPGYRLSETMKESPEFTQALKSSFDFVRRQRMTLAYRGLIGRDFPDARFVWFESLYLPLRGDGDAVEFVMNASVYTPRNAGQWS
jgi:hypothetical protein